MKFECTYPEEFYDYTNGLNISNEIINEWIKDCIDRLESNIENNHALISSGNTMVEVSRLYYDENDERYYYEVTVAKGYSQKSVGLEQFYPKKGK